MSDWNGAKWIRPEKRLALYLRDHFICTYCGRDLHDAPTADVTLDHLAPRCHGGGNDATNLVTACRSCNSARAARAWQTFASAPARRRIRRQIARPLNLDLARTLISQRSTTALAPLA